jgi:hypothetical protein
MLNVCPFCSQCLVRRDGCNVKFVQYSAAVVYWRKVLRQIQFGISHST